MINILIDVPIHAESLEQLKLISGVHVDVVEHVEAVRHIDKDLITDKHVLFCDFPPENFEDMKKRVQNLPDPQKAIEKRLLNE